METYQNQNYHIIKLQKGESVRESLESYANKHQLGLSKIEAIGLLKNVSLGFLNDQGTYDWKTYPEGELISFNGNISWDEGKPSLHAHLSLGLKDYSLVGGHFGEAIVSQVMEIFLTKISDQKIEKKHFNIVKFKTWSLEK